MPPGYRINTKVSLQVLYRLWYYGIPDEKICPFEFLKHTDLHRKDSRLLTSMQAMVTEIEKFLPESYRSLGAGDEDTEFKEAFDRMAAEFAADDIDSEVVHKKAPERAAFTTLYHNYFLPSNKRKSIFVV